MSWELYLRDVLGVREVVWPQGPEAAVPGNAEGDSLDLDPASMKILFLIEPGASPLSEFDLFLKMRAAMKLLPSESRIWEIDAVDLAVRENEISNDWVVVAFSKRLADYLRTQRPRLSMIETVSPFQVEKEPKFKRQVWDDLKQALEKAGLTSRLQS